VEEVLKASKEKEAAAKRERLKMNLALGESPAGGVGLEAEIGFRGTGTMELPKDRTQLANMRVIRRNLVYAVGLSPAIASEDILRKPEYFGQYGKISKIVLNRGNITTPPVPSIDPRRLSASAYVTFVHKVRASPTFTMSPANVFVSLCFNPHDPTFFVNYLIYYFSIERRTHSLAFWPWTDF
jgi:hypothetical protein